MMTYKYQNHNTEVQRFFDAAKARDPKHYAEVMAKYPVQSYRRQSRVRKREYASGLLGLEKANISKYEAQSYGLDSIYIRDDEDEM